MSKKILFMGTPDYATTIFERLNKSSYEVVGIFTQPDKKVGRKQVLTSPHIKKYCEDNEVYLPIFQPNKLKDNKEVMRDILKLNPDFIVVAAYGQILPKEILDIAPCINLHASLLPKYRGASPIQESILNDDKYTGVTSMLMDVGLDSGNILGYKYLKLTKDMTVVDVFDKLSIIAAELTITTLDKYEEIKPKEQVDCEVSYCKKIKKEDGLISLQDAKHSFLKYKAYCFWPGIFLESKLKLKEIDLIEDSSKNKEGEILEIKKDYIILGCKKGSLKVKIIQAPSKKAINAVDYIRGKRLEIGDILN